MDIQLLLCSVCGTDDNVMPKPINGRKYFLCRPCNAKRTKAHYDKSKVIVIEHYGGKCICCGESQLLFLSIDHVNNDGYTHLWESGRRISGVQLYSKIVSEGFPDRYQLMCMNCNFGKRMNNGTCPHNGVE